MDFDTLPYADFDQIFYAPQFAADCLGITTKALRSFEDEPGMEVRRMNRGSVPARVYTPADLFKIASIRRSKGLTKTLQRPLTISTFVQKGGTAKTTTSVNLAMYLGFMGLKVLLIDNDPQGDATSMLGYDPDLTPEELVDLGIPADRAVNGSLGNIIATSSLFAPKGLADIIKKPFGEYGPHLLPAEGLLEDMEVAINASANQDFRYALFISKGRKRELPQADLSGYDVILFDNAPSGSLMTRNSMVASDMILCPIRMDKFSCRALARLGNKLQSFAEEYQRSPDVAAIPTMFIKNRPRAMAHLAALSQMFPGKVTEGKLYFSEDYSKALESGLPVLGWKGASENSAGAMRSVFGEILERLVQM
ncbi:TPA: AAA family ATPase [Pseudomonas aeruginosa]|jgi:chromosome partitioning protein|uniref:AAA family ATPase n=1 Tax=Pseudomonas TaxID=286 RepID=UPI0008543ABA|nr:MULTISPECIES: AAA family ATPase [Pseudomonas]MBU0885508.1 AAA family ATPase [Gammaproteobacteria bacterium]EKY0806550.1 AAA family ATPase [Pseudomonas aeruginosa]MBU1858509.1 AAA family ATPase [Gammaproteobacteria bacterium]OEO25164.1 chromosome partitioning protein ParA [Pseudomonas sp. J237]OOL34329.1 chromosome partitioning protein ParA [Pseudomonas sp. FSL W5-0299]|tara:strand:+ start:3366 stop:4460 length:1095 start_codon:yes stop_codon:yes gene_type:complete